MEARLGLQIELLQKVFSQIIPSAANLSIVGLGFNFAKRPPYAPIASDE